ncbi:amidohydrolase [Microlunatus ginsengisoli]|uniref:Amidohydrolase n=1 Tax=Microlunatus ginsengisoli TaxID=363863 RepID=A0ABP7A4A7_9ACTN
MGAIVFGGGTIATGSERGDLDRLVVVDGRVAEPGAADPAGAEVVDLGGGYLGPAFGDGHAHLMQAGREFSGPEIRSASSVADVVASVRAWADAHPDAEWIVGASYDATLTSDGRFDARWLDEAVADRPVVLRAWDYHTAWCNSRALELAGITADTPDPADGIIARRPDGSPLGTLIESGATDRVFDLVPPTSVEQGVEELRRSTAFAASCGITWVQDAWVEPGDVDAWVAAAEQGALSVDADLAIRADPVDWPEQVGELAGLRDRIERAPGITARTLKFFVDGIIENHTAYLLADYADACTRGLPVWTDDQLRQAFVDADLLGFDIHLHAIGDGGVRLALDATQHLRGVTGWSDRRVTLAHAQLVDEADLARFAALDVTVCFQPLWAVEDAVMRDLTLPRLGPERSLHYRIRSVLDAGARISFGSDWPVTSPEVLAGIRTAVTRETPDGWPAGGWHPAERITVTEALTAATRGVAYQGRSEGVRGALVPDAQADLVWLSADPRSVAPKALTDVRVLGTWRRGTRTF